MAWRPLRSPAHHGEVGNVNEAVIGCRATGGRRIIDATCMDQRLRDKLPDPFHTARAASYEMTQSDGQYADASGCLLIVTVGGGKTVAGLGTYAQRRGRPTSKTIVFVDCKTYLSRLRALFGDQLEPKSIGKTDQIRAWDASPSSPQKPIALSPKFRMKSAAVIAHLHQCADRRWPERDLVTAAARLGDRSPVVRSRLTAPKVERRRSRLVARKRREDLFESFRCTPAIAEHLFVDHGDAHDRR
jgi:hypothetical protein